MLDAKNAKILIAASEFEPFTNIGHLGRVVQNLSVAIKRISAESGCEGESAGRPDVRVVIPKYGGIPERYIEGSKPVCEFEATLGRRTYPCEAYQTSYRGVTVYLLSCGGYFIKDQVYTSVVEDIERYSCFCNALLLMLPKIGFIPDIVQCHDWQMSYIPTLYNTNRNRRSSDINIKTLFVIHSMQYQGICSRYEMLDMLDLSNDFFTPSTLEFYGQANSLKGGLLFSDRLVTVSPNFSLEIQHAYYGENLEGIIRARSTDISGILCGIDPEVYDPSKDDRIYMQYDINTVSEHKPRNKCRLQQLLGFEQNPNIPLLIIISDELDYDKGIDLVKFVFDEIVSYGIQMILASKGKSDYHEFFTAKAAEYRDRIAYVKYMGGASWEGAGRLRDDGADMPGNNASAGMPNADVNAADGYMRKYANVLTETMLIGGSDILLRPSRVEPCGEKHLIALKYGTLPVIRETGGLKDAVVSYKSETGEGNGFSFANYNAHDMLYTIERAIRIFRNDRETWNMLIKAAMRVNATWADAAAQYISLYKNLIEAR